MKKYIITMFYIVMHLTSAMEQEKKIQIYAPKKVQAEVQQVQPPKYDPLNQDCALLPSDIFMFLNEENSDKKETSQYYDELLDYLLAKKIAKKINDCKNEKEIKQNTERKKSKEETLSSMMFEKLQQMQKKQDELETKVNHVIMMLTAIGDNVESLHENVKTTSSIGKKIIHDIKNFKNDTHRNQEILKQRLERVQSIASSGFPTNKVLKK